MRSGEGPWQGPAATDLPAKDTATPGEPCPKCGRPMWSGHPEVAHGADQSWPLEVNGAIYLPIEQVFELLDAAERPLLSMGDAELLTWRRSWLRERSRVTP